MNWLVRLSPAVVSVPVRTALGPQKPLHLEVSGTYTIHPFPQSLYPITTVRVKTSLSLVSNRNKSTAKLMASELPGSG